MTTPKFQSLAGMRYEPSPKAKPVYHTLREKISAESLARRDRDARFAESLANAQMAGRLAGATCRPHPMIVYSPGSFPLINGAKVDLTKPVYVVDDGACGFAWVNVRPGNSPFAKWLVKHGHARKAYGGGVDIWVSEFGQSIERKEAMATEMAKVLRSNLGVDAHANSRLD